MSFSPKRNHEDNQTIVTQKQFRAGKKSIRFNGLIYV